MIPALQRYYGGSPMDWLTMPMVLLRAYAAAMPMLRAGESMQMAEVVAYGGGNLEKRDAQRVQERWREALEGEGRPTPPTPELLASVGIGFKREYRTQGAEKK